MFVPDISFVEDTLNFCRIEKVEADIVVDRDDGEVFAAKLIAEHGEPDPDDPVLRCLGGEFTLPDEQILRR